MNRAKSNHLNLVTCPFFASFPFISHGTTCRQGGVSLAPYRSLDLNLQLNNTKVDVSENFKRLKQQLELNNPVFAEQVHQDQIVLIDESNRKSAHICDGFITAMPNVTLMIKHADCQAAIFFDPIKKVIANIHCGWRGSVANIYAKTIQLMSQSFGCSPTSILVYISPSLGPNHSEFKHYQQELPQSFWDYQYKPFYFDFWKISEDQLMASGIKKEHIFNSKMCTYSQPEDFFSYRRDRETGRHITFVCLNKA